MRAWFQRFRADGGVEGVITITAIALVFVALGFVFSW